MKRVRILRDGAIGDPGNVRAPVVHAVTDQIIELSDTAADMAVNESEPPRAEYIDGKSEPGHESGRDDDPDSSMLDPADESLDDDGDEPESKNEDKPSLLDRITGKGKGESSVLE